MGSQELRVKRLGPLDRPTPPPKIVRIVLKQAGEEQMTFTGYIVLETEKEFYVAMRKITQGRKHYYGFIKEVPKSRVEKYDVLHTEV